MKQLWKFRTKDEGEASKFHRGAIGHTLGVLPCAAVRCKLFTSNEAKFEQVT